MLWERVTRATRFSCKQKTEQCSPSCMLLGGRGPGLGRGEGEVTLEDVGSTGLLDSALSGTKICRNKLCSGRPHACRSECGRGLGKWVFALSNLIGESSPHHDCL